MLIGLAQISPRLGDFTQNAKLILAQAQSAYQAGCDLLIFPELSLLGYPPFDLLERPEVFDLHEAALAELRTNLPAQLGVVLGVLERAEGKGKPFYDAAVLLHEGLVKKVFRKHLLPTFDVFDDARFFRPGHMKDNSIRFRGLNLQVLICEDMWGWSDNYESNPLESLSGKDIDLIINLSASPYTKEKRVQREMFARQTCRLLQAPLVYVNQVGAQDELIFDGQSFVMNPKGEKIAQANSFESDFLIFDMSKPGANKPLPKSLDLTQEIRLALVTGLREFFSKTGTQRAHLGLSGGIDSAVVLCLLVEALGPQNVTAIALPTHFNAPESLTLAEQLAKNVGCRFHNLPIQGLYETALMTFTTGFGERSFGLLHENLQARLRALLLMAFSNDQQSLLVSTSNKSELAMGYSTLYGDQCGAIAPIGDLLKREVYDLAEYYSGVKRWIPQPIITRPPSAELRPNQKDSDSLPPYPELDSTVESLIAKAESAQSPLQKDVLRRCLASEFKRWQAPPILKISSHAFGRGRRMPIAGASLMDPREG